MIGVIAALTIPSLIQSYKKNQIATALKESYSIITNAIRLSEVSNGETGTWNFRQQSDNFAKQYIFPYIKTSQICGWHGIAPAGCFAKENGRYNFQTFNGTKQLYVADNYATAIMANEMSLGVFSSNGIWGNPSAMFAIDIDGPAKGGSVIGKDVFFFTLTGYASDKMVFSPGMDNYNRGYIKRNIDELLGTTIDGACNLTVVGAAERYAGGQCAAVIYKNGWKIPDNYLIKAF
ncbi:MAG: hypothetical protein K6A44_01050 [bacterium]|nr:hypothetical protein [bacterium]